MKTEIYCDRCHGTNINHTSINDEHVTRVPMSEMNNTLNEVVPMVHHTKRFKATCQSCGHSVEYNL